MTTECGTEYAGHGTLLCRWRWYIGENRRGPWVFKRTEAQKLLLAELAERPVKPWTPGPDRPAPQDQWPRLDDTQEKVKGRR